MEVYYIIAPPPVNLYSIIHLKKFSIIQCAATGHIKHRPPFFARMVGEKAPSMKISPGCRGIRGIKLLKVSLTS